MARQILDSVVITNCIASGNEAILATSLYGREVVDEYGEKINMTKSPYGLNQVLISDAIKQRYDSLEFSQEDPTLIMAGRPFPTTVQRIKLLKAIILSNASANEDWRLVTNKLMILLCKAIIQKSPLELPFRLDTRETPAQQLIIDSISTYIKTLKDIEYKEVEVPIDAIR